MRLKPPAPPTDLLERADAACRSARAAGDQLCRILAEVRVNAARLRDREAELFEATEPARPSRR